MNIKQGNIESRTRNTKRNIVNGFAAKVISLFFPFVVRTIMIQKMGAEYVGTDSLFASILQVLNMTELGFSSAITFALYKPVAENNKEEICRYLTIYKSIYLIVGTIILVLGLLLLPFLPKLIKADCPENLNIYWLFLIYLSSTVISYFAYGYKSVILTAHQRNDILSKIEFVITVARSMVQIVVLIFLDNYYLYALMMPVFTLLSNVAMGAITRKTYPELVCFEKLSLTGIKELSTQIKGVALGKLAYICRNALDSIILSMLLGLIVTAKYSNYYYVFTAVTTMLTVLLRAMAASVGNSIATESIQKNYNDHLKFDFYYMLLTSICVCCMVCLYQPFMTIWAGEEMLLPTETMILFCMYFYVNCLAQVRSVYSEAAGLWWHFRYFTLGEMFANLVLNIVLGRLWGINGIILATIITAFLSSFIGITQVVFRRYFKASSLEFYRLNLLYAIVAFLVAFVAYSVCSLVSVSGILGLIIRGVICVVISLCCLSMVYLLNSKTRGYLKVLMSMVLHR